MVVNSPKPKRVALDGIEVVNSRYWSCKAVDVSGFSTSNREWLHLLQAHCPRKTCSKVQQTSQTTAAHLENNAVACSVEERCCARPHTRDSKSKGRCAVLQSIVWIPLYPACTADANLLGNACAVSYLGPSSMLADFSHNETCGHGKTREVTLPCVLEEASWYLEAPVCTHFHA